MKKINRLRATSLVQFALALGLASQNIATADVVFSESFESPAVTDFQSSTVPDNGNWIGSSGAYNSSVRGLYNDFVAWPSTPKFTTPYGDQAYYLNYSTTMLTTAQGATGQTITAGVSYTLTFNAAFLEGTSADYKAELVAFDAADDNDARKDPNSPAGTVVASANGAITASDMSDSISVFFAPDGANAHLGKELAIRFDDAAGSALYDNVRLIVGHDFAPTPESGEDLSAGGNVTLSWANMPPVAPATQTYVDILFGTDPASLSLEVDGQLTSSVVVNAPTAGTYYWRIDSYPDGDPNGTAVSSNVYNFTIADTDGDGLPDDYEVANATDPSSPTANTDLDSTSDLDVDELTAAEEYNYGTDPNDADSDNDTLLDGPEINGTAGDRPVTNPLLADTDGDGLNDNIETNTGVWVSSADTGTNPTDNDWDKDGLLDGVETNTDTFSDKTDTGTDPYDPDTDADGAGDYYEIYASFTDPFVDTDKPQVPYPLPDPDGSTGATDKPVKVFICSGQSNMVGIGNVYGTEEGTLETITKRQNKFPNLLDASNNWTERQDVRYRGVISATANGPLTAGQGAGTTNLGPELGFGHIMGYYHEEAVLVLKSSIGNRSLGWDILPAGSPSYEYGTDNYAGYGERSQTYPIGESSAPWTTGDWYAGYEWDRYFLDESEWAHPHDAVTNVVDILDNWVAEYSGPGKPFEGRDFEIAGFVWWQGDKDRYDMGHATRYEENLVNLINTLRSYYSDRYPGKVPTSAPFVLATLGQTVLGDSSNLAEEAILNAQLAVDGGAGNYPEYVDNVKTVYANPLSQGGASNGHYNGNAETYMLVGDALGRAMIDLIEAAAGPDEIAPVAISRSPVIDETDVSAGANIVVNFNEPIAIDTGNVTLRNLDLTTDTVIDITDGTQVTISGSTLTINPTSTLATSTQYAVLIDATAIDDLAVPANSFAGISDDTTWNFTTAAPDTTDPTLNSTDPENSATVVVDTDLEVTFSESIAIGSGNITLRNLTDGAGGDILIDVTDGSQVSVSGAVLTINPSADLLEGKDYAVQIDASAIEDLVGNSFAGIADDVTWVFSTPAPPPAGVVFFDDFETGGNPDTLPATTGAYTTTPDVDGYTVGNSSGQVNSAFWVESAQGHKSSQSGLVDDVYETTGWSDSDGQQAWAGRYTSNTGVTTAEGVIGNLEAGTTITVTFNSMIDTQNSGSDINAYLVTYPDGATTGRDDFRSEAVGTTAILAYLGGTATSTETGYQITYTVGDDIGKNSNVTFDTDLLGDDIALRFEHKNDALIDNVQVTITEGAGDTTAPTISTSSPSDGATGVDVSTNLVATFNEDIAAGSGNITLKNLTDVSESTIDITDGTQVSISGTMVTINPTSDLLNGKDYAVQIASTAVEDTTGNTFAGISDDTTWNFSTAAANDFSNWISGYDVGDLTGADDDADEDGISNAAENYFGTDPGSFSAGLSAKQVNTGGGTSFEFTHPISDSPATDITAVYKWTADLQSAFLNGGVADSNGTTVTFTPGTPVAGVVLVDAAITGTDPGKIFVIIDVTQNP